MPDQVSSMRTPEGGGSGEVRPIRVVIAGHWDLSGQDLSDTGDFARQALVSLQNDPSVGAMGASMDVAVADMGPTQRVLVAIREGIARTASRLRGPGGVEFLAYPIGPSTVVNEALEAGGPASGSFHPIVIGRREASTVGAGSELRALGSFGGTAVIEGGHSWHHDWGIGFLGALVGNSPLSVYSDENALLVALAEAREMLEGNSVVFSASTMRPLFGAGATSLLQPDLTLRNDARFADSDNRVAIGRWQRILRQTYTQTVARRPNLNIGWESDPGIVAGSVSRGLANYWGNDGVPGIDPGEIEGSGAGAGTAAILAALGVPVVPTPVVLSAAFGLSEVIAQADLVLVVEPHLDGPDLVDSPLPYLASLAAKSAVPVVAVGSRSSLSSRERAGWGVHSISLLRPTPQGLNPFEDVGRRIAQTWLQSAQ